ncbi:MAG TPA: hypothetical protein VMB02_11735 [Candidatus Aquilonibacter sp.]|nr:hypothetical protein [Candidatus Aquilonibacter sp.]
MRAFWLCIVALGLAVSPAMAGTGAGGDADSAGNGAANTSAKPDPAPKGSPSSLEIENQLQQLRDLLQTQSQQLQQQDEQIKEQKEQMQTLQDQLTASHANGDGTTAWVAAPINSPVGPSTGVIASGSNSGSDRADDQPASINFKGVTLTPGGFFVAETVWRQKALSADVNSPFNSIPFVGASTDHISEFNASGRQSRISMLVQGKLDNVKIGGYYETDFLSGAVTSNYNQSNSFALRQRQFFAQAAFNDGWTFTGGQMWSLVTETKKGMDNRTEATPMTIDAQYNVGFSWARQYGFRVSKNFDNKVWLGFSVENAQATSISTHGASGNWLVGAAGANGGLLPSTNNFTFNRTPDFIFKAVFEPGFGHYEVFGIVSTFRDRVFPCATTATGATCAEDPIGFKGPTGAGAFNDDRVGGGVGANARFSVAKKVDFGLHFLAGDGVGRYGTSQLPELVVRPDGTLSLVHSFQGLGSVELHPTPKLDVYLYAGDEYAARTMYGSTIGYGATGLPNFGCQVEQAPGSGGFSPTSPTNCTGDTRNIIEGTFGFWYRFYKGPKGTVQWGPQYSYVTRSTWRGVGAGTENGVALTTNGQPSAVDNMVFTSFRYYLP